MRDPKINLITAPDKLLDDNTSVLLINPDNTMKESLNDVLKNIKRDLNLYLFEEDAQNDIEWLMEVANSVDYIILNVDACEDICWLVGAFLLKTRTFYLTNHDELQYNVINDNRIYDLRQFAEGVNYFEK